MDVRNVVPRCFGHPSTALRILLVLVILSTPSCATWMSLGAASLSALASVHHHPETCRGLPGLVYKQIEICRNQPDAVLCVGEGIRRGIDECQQQFKNDRWNCSMNAGHSIVGSIPKGTREAAFIRAVTNAGIVHSVTQACSEGNLTDCSCDMARRSGQVEASEGWKWGGCSDDVTYGVEFAENFVDAQDKNLAETPAVEGVTDEEAEKLQRIVNLHNNLVGRKAVELQMKMRCRCHGVSGSCAVKSCWKSMPDFKVVGDFLKNRYRHSVEVAPRSVRKLRRRERVKRHLPIEHNELVFAKESPNFCRRDDSLGIAGTRGRECHLDTYNGESCDVLCCGRGHNTEVIRVVERCHCKFVWCCKVKCKICERMIDKHTCK